MADEEVSHCGWSLQVSHHILSRKEYYSEYSSDLTSQHDAGLLTGSFLLTFGLILEAGGDVIQLLSLNSNSIEIWAGVCGVGVDETGCTLLTDQVALD
jgi:hypothetical protein